MTRDDPFTVASNRCTPISIIIMVFEFYDDVTVVKIFTRPMVCDLQSSFRQIAAGMNLVCLWIFWISLAERRNYYGYIYAYLQNPKIMRSLCGFFVVLTQAHRWCLGGSTKQMTWRCSNEKLFAQHPGHPNCVLHLFKQQWNPRCDAVDKFCTTITSWTEITIDEW